MSPVSLARAWRRKLLSASGVALMVPGTVAGAFAVLALAGGFGRIGDLGQAFSGPSIPADVRPLPRAAGGPQTPLPRTVSRVLSATSRSSGAGVGAPALGGSPRGAGGSFQPGPRGSGGGGDGHGGPGNPGHGG